MKNKAKALSLSAFVALMLAMFLQATASVCSHDGTLAQKAHTGRDTVKLVMGMDGLRKAGPGRVIETCDLSRQGLKGIPSLKAYTILRLNLSGNDFRRRKPRYVVDSLPHSLRELNISNCGIGADLRRGEQCYCKLGRDSFPYLRVLNASGNKLTAMELSPTTLRHVDVSSNRLSILRFSDRYAVLSNGGALGHWEYRKERAECARTVEYLNISGNRSMYSGIAIAPEKIDTLLHDNSANGEKIWVGIWID